VYIKHIGGWENTICFKSYDQGLDAFLGQHVDLAALDEEAPDEIYKEIGIRTMSTNKYDPEASGLLTLTFTSEHGLTPLIEGLYRGNTGKLDEGSHNGRFITSCSMYDVPHLSAEEIEQRKKDCPPHLVQSRIYGIPGVSEGAIFPFTEDEITCKPFEIPNYFRRAYGFDSSYRGSAAIWGAYDQTRDVWYVYDEFFRDGQGTDSWTSVVALGIRSKPHGKWIRGVIDPAAEKAINQSDSRFLLEIYRDMGLDLEPANNALEFGLTEILYRFQSGRLKIFTTCKGLLADIRFYRRDLKGNIIKKETYHRIDALRYLITSGLEEAKSEFSLDRPYRNMKLPQKSTGTDPFTGY
jgi:phage terminase large subunit-like protein